MENNYKIQQEITTKIDENGNETSTIKEKKINYQRNEEPDFIKLYTKVWCEFNEIPIAYRNLFLELITRMSYCNSTDLDNSQIVFTGVPVSTQIMKALGWKKNMFQKGLKVLCDCGAIKRINRGVYQVNPSYAGRGQWKYNPRLAQGGVEDLVATFDFKTKETNVNILWADNGEDEELNNIYRNMLDSSKSDETVLKQVDSKNIDNKNNDLPFAANQ